MIVNNPKKELTVNIPYEEMLEKLKYVGCNSAYFKSVDISQTSIGIVTYQFKKPISGLIDTGMKATITASQNENKTHLTIEIEDNFSAIEDDSDMKSANMIISDLLSGINNVINKSITDLQNPSPQNSVSNSNHHIGCAQIFWITIFIISIVIICLI